MQIKAIKFLFPALLVCLFAILMFIFVPRKYQVPVQKERSGIEFWELPTGSRIAYTLIPGKGAIQPFPVIYLHGGPGGKITEKILKDLVPLSHHGFDVYLYDQVGSGHSERLSDIVEYSCDRHKQDLQEIIETINAEKVILLGHSWGAMLATLYMTDYPGRVHKAVFTSPGPILPIRNPPADSQAPDSLRLREPRFTNAMGNKKNYHTRAKAIRWLALISGKKLATDSEADDFFTLLNKDLIKSTLCDPTNIPEVEGGSGYYSHIMTIQSFSQVTDQRSRTKEIHVPVLLMKGQCDNQKWAVVREYMDHYSNHKLVVIENAGHSISIERPIVYLNTLLSFLKN